MGHTPFGYKIVDGKAVIDEEDAQKLRTFYEGYLSGMGLQAAVDQAGIEAFHPQAKRILLNKKYLGTDFYPAIIDKATMDKVIAETERRATKLGRNYAPKEKKVIPPSTKFRLTRTDIKYKDPYKQAQYIYSQIKEVETDG